MFSLAIQASCIAFATAIVTNSRTVSLLCVKPSQFYITDLVAAQPAIKLSFCQYGESISNGVFAISIHKTPFCINKVLPLVLLFLWDIIEKVVESVYC